MHVTPALAQLNIRAASRHRPLQLLLAAVLWRPPLQLNHLLLLELHYGGASHAAAVTDLEPQPLLDSQARHVHAAPHLLLLRCRASCVLFHWAEAKPRPLPLLLRWVRFASPQGSA